MLLRPVDASGDILPVLSSSVLVSGSLAVTQLVRDRLNLLAGEWWENPAWGCEVFEMMRTGRVTAQDVSALSSYLCSYIAATRGVRSVEDVYTAVNGRQLTFSCRVLTEDGAGTVEMTVPV